MIRRLTAATAAAALLDPWRPPRSPRAGRLALVLRRRCALPDRRHADRLLGHGRACPTYDRIYVLGDGLINVAEAKPGDRDYNGGRWMVLPITWSAGVTPVQLTSAEQVEAYADAGMLTIASAPVKLFECPVIPVGGR